MKKIHLFFTALALLCASVAVQAAETVYFVNVQNWTTVNAYAWGPTQNAEWPGVAATKEAEQIGGFDVYAYTAEAGAHAKVIFNNGSGDQTADLDWTAGKYYVKNGWCTKEEAEALLAGPEIPSVITYVLRGVGGDWTVGIAMTVNPDNENEYVLLGQDIAEGDAVKVVTLTDGVATAWCGNVDEYSVERSYDENGNIVLAPGKYDFYYKVAEDIIYIAAAEPAIEWIEMPLEISNLTTMEMPVEGVTYLQLMGRNDKEGADVMLFLNDYTGEEKTYEVNVENSFMTFGGLELTVMDGALTKSVDPELGDVYAGIVHASVVVEGETMYVAFDLKMYAQPAIEIAIENVEITVIEESAIAIFNATWEGSPLQVEVSGFEEVESKVYSECWLTIGDDVNWVDAAAGPVAISIEGDVAMLKGEFTSYATGKTYNVTLSGTLPVKEEPVVEPTYTENSLNTFAFGLESELNETELVVTYRLNNSNATSVNVLVYQGENVVATVAGTTTIGVNTVAIPVATLPQGRMLTWSVEVNGTSVEVPTQEAKMYSFYHPSGVDIDNNPENPTFGLILTNEGMQKVKGIEGYVSTGFGAGIYAFTPSFDPIANGDQPGFNGGIEFTEARADGAGVSYAPRRVRISEDGRIFVTSLNTDGNYLWELNPDNLNEWTPIFQGTLNENKELIDAEGNFVAAPNNGFDVKGAGENLQLAMYSVNLSGITGAAMSGFRLHEYNLGTATTWATAPSKTIVEGKYAINYLGTQVEYDNEGGVWIASYRGTATDANPGLVHINADGVEDAKLIWNNVRQAGIRFNHDFTKLIVAGNNGAAKKATIYAVSKDANGAPVLTEETVIDMASLGSNLNDFAFDYAGNLYGVSNSNEKIIGWAMPYSGQVVTPAASEYAFHIGELLPEIEWIEMPLEISNLTTMELPVEGVTYLQLMGHNDMEGADVMLFLNDYTGEEKTYEVNVENSFMTFGGLELTVMDGALTKSVDPELGDVYAGIVHASVVVEGETMYVAFDLKMYAQPAIEIAIENVEITVNEESAIAFFNATWEGTPLQVEVSGFEEVAFKKYSECWISIGDDVNWVDAAVGPATVTIADGVASLEGEFTSYATGKTYKVILSGTLPQGPGTGLDNVQVDAKAVKAIINGQLIIIKNGVQYNVQGAVVK